MKTVTWANIRKQLDRQSITVTGVTEVLLITAITLVTMLTSLDKRVKRLSEINIVLVALLLLIISAGSALYNRGGFYANPVAYGEYLPALSNPFDRSDANFSQGWTPFHWAW